MARDFQSDTQDADVQIPDASSGPTGIPMGAVTPSPESAGAFPRAEKVGAPEGYLRAGVISRIPPAGLILFGMLTVQFGAAIAISLFAEIGPGGAVLLRVGFAAMALMALWRPWRGFSQRYTRADMAAIVAFGIVFATMNFTFYVAIDRIPLGVAVTLEFVGPLGVAVAGSRRLLDVLWAVMAASGILLFAPIPAGSSGGAMQLDSVGLVFALLAGGCWACYILLSSRVGKAAPGGGGLAMALTVGTIAILPVGILSAGPNLLQPTILLAGAAVALLSSVIPYSLEFIALRRMTTGAFGVFMSLEPGIATLVGLLVLHEGLTLRSAAALLLVTTASLGATRTGNGAI